MRNFLVTLLAVVAMRTDADALSLDRFQSGSMDTPYSLFKEIAKVYRPSGKEHAMREWILRLVAKAQAERWPGRTLEVFEDGVGNLLVRIPGTGRFRDARAAAIALQAHLDMVCAATDRAKAVSAFINGIALAESGDFVHSVGNCSTIGADNGAGLALALHYLVDPTLEHPPLELLFTVDEEENMTGVLDMDLPLTSPILINLDRTTEGEVCYGCGAGQVIRATVPIPSARIFDRREGVRLDLSGLPGGHSGADIYRDRPNAILAGVWLVRSILKAFPAVSVTGLEGGTAFNAIPFNFTAHLASPLHLTERVKRFTAARFARLRHEFGREGAKAKLSVAREKVSSMHLTSAKALSLMTHLLEIPDGALIKHPDFPRGVHSSSNFGVLKLDAELASLRAQLMVRSYGESDLADLVTRLTDRIKGAATYRPVRYEHEDATPLWLERRDSSFFDYLAEQQRDLKFVLATGLLEPAIIAKRQRHVVQTMISLGPDIFDYHSRFERMSISSLRRTAGRLAEILKNLDGCDAYLKLRP